MQYSDLSPDDFFNNFVALRKPVLMDGCLAKNEGWRGDRWTNQYLRDKVPRESVFPLAFGSVTLIRPTVAPYVCESASSVPFLCASTCTRKRERLKGAHV